MRIGLSFVPACSSAALQAQYEKNIGKGGPSPLASDSMGCEREMQACSNNIIVVPWAAGNSGKSKDALWPQCVDWETSSRLRRFSFFVFVRRTLCSMSGRLRSGPPLPSALSCWPCFCSLWLAPQLLCCILLHGKNSIDWSRLSATNRIGWLQVGSAIIQIIASAQKGTFSAFGLICQAGAACMIQDWI